ncbi:hypothetical protein D3C79_884590 [compost metagenome]
MVERPVQQGHAVRLEVLVPGLQLLHAIDDEPIVVQGLQPIGRPCPAPQRQVVVTTSEIHQVFVGTVQHFHAQHIDVETLTLLQVGHQQGNMTQAVQAARACRQFGHWRGSIFVYNSE